MDSERTPLSDSDLDVIFRASELMIPDDLKAGVYAAARDLKQVTQLLRQPRTAASEPSNIFSLIRRS
ncbi:hypothetical protein SAMN05216548_10371 [Faunimonas pinastri]|uniref:Uncharacterized protein n=1 Tax=Faunimonas pinastri TaxID=1855383 RepID=A0A1H9E5D6_9HYPH|nr:hypothetical protein [Faunimonas pinastri]SEQ20889.1 hypothetical protein SAMN05216548_10371 [Faunimonas pinastri]